MYCTALPGRQASQRFPSARDAIVRAWMQGRERGQGLSCDGYHAARDGANRRGAQRHACTPSGSIACRTSYPRRMGGKARIAIVRTEETARPGRPMALTR